MKYTLDTLDKFVLWRLVQLLEPESIWNYSWQWWNQFSLWIRQKHDFFVSSTWFFGTLFIWFHEFLKLRKTRGTSSSPQKFFWRVPIQKLYIWERRRLNVLCITYCCERTDSGCCLEWQSAHWCLSFHMLSSFDHDLITRSIRRYNWKVWSR